MKHLKTYKVRVSPHAVITCNAFSEKGAKQQVWDDIKNHYSYGWKSKAEFMEKASVSR